uniref:Integrase core domain-containing protein n=1 Tax=Magallana gigas TaxID=29159 RepID=A0A8W8MKW5_MAGGI
MVCLKEMNQQELHKKIKEYFYKGFNSRLIHYLIQRNNNYDISYNCLVRKLLPRLGLKRRHADIDIDEVFEKSQIEIQNGCAGSENLRRTLKMKYHFNVTRWSQKKETKKTKTKAVFQQDGYDKLKPFGISIHGCIDGFSRRVIWLEADITNKRPEVVAEYYLSAVQLLKGCPQKFRADPGTENGIIATFHSCLKENCSSVTLGTSTANQRIERFWGLLRQMRADFWIHHFKDLVYEDLLVLGNPIHRLCIQYVYLPLIKKDLKEIMEQWNNHLIRRQKLGDTVQGIPDVLFKNPEIVGASQYIHSVPHNTVARLQGLVSNNFKQIDEDFAHVATLILHQHGLPLPDALGDWTSARQLYIFLQESITHLMNLI